MKKIILRISLVLMLVNFFTTRADAIIIHSTTGGGIWDSTSTWMGGLIPGVGDTVVISQYAAVTIGHTEWYDIYHSWCAQITIESNATLTAQDYGGGLATFILYVSGHLINYGTVSNGNEYVDISIAGDLSNFGYYRPHATHFSGPGIQKLALSTGNVFGGWMTAVTGTTLVSETDFTYDGVYYHSGESYQGDFNMGGATLNMGNHRIKSVGTIIYGGTIAGDFEIAGTFRVSHHATDTLFFAGNITVTDTLQSNLFGGGTGMMKLKIDGNLTNNGWVRDHDDADDYLHILITGNIINNGSWTCGFVTFIGNNDQYIEGNPFESNFTDLDPQSKICLNSDIQCLGNFELKGATLDGFGHALYLTGWLYDGYIHNIGLDRAILRTIESIDNLTITGKVTVDDNNLFRNKVTVNDTLQANTFGGGTKYFDLQIDGDITNYGWVLNDIDDRLRLKITGDIDNQGKWESYETLLIGTGNQHITLMEGKTFGGEFIDSEPGSMNIAASDLVFTGNFNLNGSILAMGNKRLALSGTLRNGTLDEAILKGGYLNHITATTMLSLEGTVSIEDLNTFQCPVTVNDTLRANNYGGGSMYYDLPVQGNFVNYGLITDSGNGSGMLRLYIKGNISNDGEWINRLTQLEIDDNLFIELIGNKPIESAVVFKAPDGSPTYQWYFNGTFLDSPDFEGETSQYLTWNVPVTKDWYGVFSCETTGREVVGVTIKEGFTGIEDPGAGMQESVEVYPNPTTGQFKVQSSKFKGEFQSLELIDFYGNVMKINNHGTIEPLNNQTIELNISHLPSGIYFLRINIENQSIVKKIIKI
ncbi:hypothetical protein DSECCO2_356450 [anaerobic digester metagenome]|jgi:hypothetical protein|nr:T9SS type A sorting domain-containing protein [Bacteroidales bacterium]